MYCLCSLALIILMRASASLYPYIYGAHSKMIKVYVPWQRLQVDKAVSPLKTDPAILFGTLETTKAL
ncbi:hypothetical protein CPB97_011037 [Podila verticillata]|nr:hypothetical protein CPB97_011037 [Podila verticillata]